jgi:hypothetical protein
MSQLERVREICMRLPDAEERASHGEPAWFVRGKRQFASFANHHHDDRLAVWFAAPQGLQEALVQSEPERYFRPPYVGPRGWIGAYLDVEVDWAELEEMLTEAHKTVAQAKRR